MNTYALLLLAASGLLLGCDPSPQSSREASAPTVDSLPKAAGQPQDTTSQPSASKDPQLETVTAADYAKAPAIADLPAYPDDTTANHSATATFEAARLRLTKGRVERRDSVLIFYPTAARPLHFVSSNCEVSDSCTVYLFLGSIPKSEYWLAEIGYYEGHDYLLVHQRTGQHVVVDDYPSVSPSGRWAVSAANAYQDIYQTDGLTLWQLSGATKPQLQWRRNESWTPQALRWADDQKLLIKATESDARGNDHIRYFRLQLPQ